MEVPMEYQTIRWQLDAGILTLTLNRPDQLNAFTVPMMSALVHAFGRAREDDAVRAIVVTGAGRAFCAGMDLAGGAEDGFGLGVGLGPSVAELPGRPRGAAIQP